MNIFITCQTLVEMNERKLLRSFSGIPNHQVWVRVRVRVRVGLRVGSELDYYKETKSEILRYFRTTIKIQNVKYFVIFESELSKDSHVRGLM